MSNTQKSNSEALPPYMKPDQPAPRKIFAWWFRLSCPPEPPSTAPLIQRERYRRARTISIIAFLLQFYNLISLPAGFFGLNRLLVVLVVISIFIDIAAMFVNRRGWVTLAGLLLVFSVEFGQAINIVTAPGGIGLASLPIFDLMVIPLVLAASVLPAFYVFVFAAFNSIFTLLGILYLPHHSDLVEALKTAGIGLVTLPIAIQIILAFLAFLWVRSAEQAIKRADRAEQIALLEHDIAESRQLISEQKMQLDTSIQEISRALLNSNNGRGVTRMPTQGNPLWLIVGPINNLLARMDRMRHVEAEYQQLTMELEQLLVAIRTARTTHQPLHPSLRASSARLGLFYDEIAHLQVESRQTMSRELPWPTIHEQR